MTGGTSLTCRKTTSGGRCGPLLSWTLFVVFDSLSESKCLLMDSALERYSATSDRIKDLDCSVSSSVLACYEWRYELIRAGERGMEGTNIAVQT